MGSSELKKPTVFLLLSALIIITSITLYLRSTPQKIKDIARPLADATTSAATNSDLQPTAPVASATPVPTPLGSPELVSAVESALIGTKGNYGIVIKNLKTGESYEMNGHRVFEPGSLYKVWVMAVAYNQIQNGKLDLDDTMEDDIAQLNQEFQIPPDSAELTEGTMSFTVSEAMEQMITISHNYAALMLTKKVTLQAINAFITQNGFNESKVGTNGDLPTTTPSDVALFFEKLYQGKLANKEYTDAMIALLKRQELNDLIPKYLPDDLEVAHKTGNINAFDNDAGIVYAPNGDYIIVAMSESNSPPLAEERIAGVSKNVYDYFENTP